MTPSATPDPLLQTMELLSRDKLQELKSSGRSGGTRDRSDPIYCLQLAMDQNDFFLLEEAIEKGIDPNHPPVGDMTALERFLEHDNEGAVRFLIEHGARVGPYLRGQATLFTPLMNNNLFLAKLLISHGAKADVLSYKIQDPAKNPYGAPIQEHLLLSLAANIHIRSGFGKRGCSNSFLGQTLKISGWPRIGPDAKTYRSFLSINMLQRIAGNARAHAHQPDDKAGKILLQLILQEYQLPYPPKPSDMKQLEDRINEGLRPQDPKFHMEGFLMEALAQDDFHLLNFLTKSGWLHSFRVVMDQRLVSPLWAVIDRRDRVMWEVLKKNTDLISRARDDFNADPSTFFKLLSNLTLEDLGQSKFMDLDWKSTDPLGNTFFHYLSRNYKMLKGHLNFAVEVGADEALSLKNKDGYTPFSIPAEGGHIDPQQRGAMQSYFEQAILPKTLRKHRKEQGQSAALQQAVRRRM